MASYLSAKPGDLIEICRGLYSHWAVYIGNGEVVHFGSRGDCDNLIHHHDTVMREKLSDVVGSDNYKINNQLDGKHKPYPGPSIVKRALEIVGQELSYDLFRNNCEHFATWLRYGEATSEQVRTAAGVVVGAVVIAILFILVCCWCRSKNKKEKHQFR